MSYFALVQISMRPPPAAPTDFPKVYRDLPEVAIELPREADASRDAADRRGDEVVQVAVRRRRELQGTEADVVERLG